MTTEVSVTDATSGVSEGDEPEVKSGVPGTGMSTNKGEAADGKPVTTAQVDQAEKIRQELLKKHEQDISKLRSSLDSRFSQKQKEWEKREADFRQALFEAETRGLPEDEVRKRRLEHAESEIVRLQQEREQLETALTTQNVAQQWVSYFESQGIGRDNLVLDGGLEALIQSGWNAVTQNMTAMKQEIEKLKAGEKGDSPSTDGVSGDGDEPKVVGHKIVKSSTGLPSNPSWNDLIEKYGSPEAVYTAIEQYQLDPSVLPKED